jgi:hypothetical protein
MAITTAHQMLTLKVQKQVEFLPILLNILIIIRGSVPLTHERQFIL